MQSEDRTECAARRDFRCPRSAEPRTPHNGTYAELSISGDPSPSADDFDLTDRLRAAAGLVGVLARDHVIVAATGYYSFVEAGRWRR
jgi:DNA repair protein RadC